MVLRAIIDRAARVSADCIESDKTLIRQVDQQTGMRLIGEREFFCAIDWQVGGESYEILFLRP